MENENIVKETALSVAKETAKDVYADTVQPTAKNVGGFFGTLSGFFNHVVMYPLKKLNIRYEQKAIAFEKEMEHKYNSIPEKERVEPQLHIVGPTMESLKYNIMDDDLAELFSNLLVSDMDMRTQNLCTPAFVKVIEQLSPADARVFKAVFNECAKAETIPICKVDLCKIDDEKRKIRKEYLPLYLVGIEVDKLASDGNLLIMGGPGSGKTTIALFKAKELTADSNTIRKSQKILFLSFARATISRVEEQAGELIPQELKKQIEINTYHGFIWNIIKHHGYLLNSQPLHLLPPHESGHRLSGLNEVERKKKMLEMFNTEGTVHFDIFANICTRLLTESHALKKIICAMYPVIILDEFQDTSADEWQLIQLLGTQSKLIALADPEQRIYDFRGADPKRITQFIESFKPKIFDFGQQNNRSNGKDIAEFGNDLLQGKNAGKRYKDVSVCRYPFRKLPYTHLVLKYKVLEVQKSLYEMKKTDWSLAILVPTNALMLEVSDSFQREQQLQNGKKCPVIEHEVAVDTAGPYLAALTIASILETGSQKCCTESAVLTPLIEHILGRKGADKPPSKADVSLASALSQYSSTKKIQGKNREKLIADTQDIVSLTNSAQFSGNVINDWKIVLTIIGNEQSEAYQNLLKDAKHLRLLQRGSQLYAALDILWRENGSYIGATEAVANALTQEHFSMSTRKWSGINIMTIHKSKGKEFDAVIIYEGRYQNRIISKPERREQAILNLRVAVTRAKEHTYILTPEDDPCSLL